MSEPVVNRMFGLNFYDPLDRRSLAIYEPVREWLHPPDRDMQHFEWELMVDIPSSGDGRRCKIYEMRCPSRFFKLVVEASPNYKGEMLPAWKMSSGSGDEMGVLIVSLAIAVSTGMQDVKPL
jgi:hypothetical protein